MLTKGNFTRDERNHLFCLFFISHFSSTVCSEAMAKRVQQDSGEERVTAKSRPMMSLVARDPSTLSSSASESPGKKSYGSQSPWSAKAEKDDRTEQPVVDRDVYSARYSRWDDDKAWSSQEWKADKSIDDRTRQPVVASWARTHEFQSSFSHEKIKHVVLEEEARCRFSKRSTATAIHHWTRRKRIGFVVRIQIILNMVNDQVRKRQKRSSMNITENDEKHSVI